MPSALLPGTFDPPTLGHLDLIRRAAQLFDPLFIGLATTQAVPPLFSFEERREMLQRLLADLTPQPNLVSLDGLTVAAARKHQVDCLVRGLRQKDIDHEFELAIANRSLGGIETVLLLTDPKLAPISSSLVREIGRLGGSLASFIPQPILEMCTARLKS